ERVRVTLPVGMEINPAVANGPLQTCSAALIDAGGAGCPATSVQGTVNLTTPLLPTVQTGNVYLENPGGTAATRYKLAIVIHLPGKDLILHGGATVDGSSDHGGGVGSVDTGTGQVVADFNGIPDLGFTDLQIVFNTGDRALLANPKSCGSHSVSAAITPHGGGSDATPSGSFTTSYDGLGAACPGSDPFAPVFTGSVSTTAAGGNPNLTLNVARPDKSDRLSEFNMHLPAGMVANATVVPQCTQASAAAGDCASTQPGSQVGTVTTAIGTGGESLTISGGGIYNVVPNANEPARLQAIIPVVVGPYDLGKLSIPVLTSLRPDMGVDTTTTLPSRYEGIAVNIRSLSMVLNGIVGGNGFMINPSKCQSNTVTADMVGATVGTVTGSFNYTTTGCPSNFVSSPTISATVNPSETAKPTGLTLGVGSSASNPTIGRIQMTFPVGMELNPAAGNGLQACPSADITAGGTACPGASVLGSVSLTTPLLTGVQNGSIFLEQPGTTAATRYKLAIIINLPGQKLVVRGATTVDGSSDIAGGTGASDTGNGRVTADFQNIPDLAFTNMTIAFNLGNRALFTTPQTCGSHAINATITPNSGGADASPSTNFTTSYDGLGGACPGSDPFAPVFTGSVSTTASGGHPDLNLQITRPDKHRPLRSFAMHLPVGFVADTVTTNRCPQVDANAGNCQPNTVVGSITTQVGSGNETLSLSGTINNTEPNASEPARLQAIVPVVVGPFDLGKLSIPIGTSLRGDLGVDTSATIPMRYEGVPVRIRDMNITINGVVAGNGFMVNPSRCKLHTVSADMLSTSGAPVTGSFDYITTGCPSTFLPTIGAAVTDSEPGQPSGLSLDVNVPAGSSTLRSIVTTLPAGMEINPAIGNNNGGLAACDTADLDAGGAACPV
ncbi:MAG: hypothetical protein HZB14_08910, partial [Actinobacteria bacterium]|nr:hypothetical protein [Actinomycetota bacterium]